MNVKEMNMRQIKFMRNTLNSCVKIENWSIKRLSEISGINKKILMDIENGKDCSFVSF